MVNLDTTITLHPWLHMYTGYFEGGNRIVECNQHPCPQRMDTWWGWWSLMYDNHGIPSQVLWLLPQNVEPVPLSCTWQSPHLTSSNALPWAPPARVTLYSGPQCNAWYPWLNILLTCWWEYYPIGRCQLWHISPCLQFIECTTLFSWNCVLQLYCKSHRHSLTLNFPTNRSQTPDETAIKLLKLVEEGAKFQIFDYSMGGDFLENFTMRMGKEGH